jgi:hypothetical protein
VIGARGLSRLVLRVAANRNEIFGG